jgi:hydroxyacylglutathione hydrolase
MKITDKIHRLKIVFNVTPEIERFVYMYIIEGKKLYLIDTGVDGAEKVIAEYLSGIGKCMKDIAAVFLTHSHPDHIGAASEIKRISACKVYAGCGEHDWIENINKQFEERPIPNFHKLVNKSVMIDQYLKDGDIIKLEEDITIKVIDTRGHSQESLSFYFEHEKALFTGDAIPVVGDIPIYINAQQSMETLERLKSINNVDVYLSAWDEEKDTAGGLQAINDGLNLLKMIDTEVRSIASEYPNKGKEDLFKISCERLNMNQFAVNPLFKKSIFSNLATI